MGSPFLKSTQEQLAEFREFSDNGVALVHIDTCLSCYLQDHHNRDGELLLGVYVTGETRIRDLFHDLSMELNETFLEDGERGGFNYDRAAAAIAAEKARYSDEELEKPFDSTLETPSDEEFNSDAGEMCQAWFVLTWETQTEEESDDL